MTEIIQQGGIIMYPLILCSVASFAAIIDRTLFWIYVKRKRNQPLVDEVLSLCAQRQWDEVREKTRGSRDYMIRILVSGILHRDFSMAKAMESAAAAEIKKMRRFMGVIDTMITAAPLLGILGTVTGIIASFKAFGGYGLDNPAAVMAGIAQALVTTAFGLGIAIFSVFPYNYFYSRIESAATEIETCATSLEIVFEKGTP
ncbi:putative biopolymer transport protein ExbB-like [Candidatus Desulfarcum epimagneticum]|uniref:Putative biopolymer transport protein ExbB-like n=1 Tax=uncultured Desulfobacteraceae bacterium TaxID=218296 RepID=A0A484HHH4_9BACT|nr:putative biopolymer transport protein ExbB-like [uncultured Desulfobacteraceae bacterium]